MTFKWELESHNRTCITRVPRGHGWASGFESEWKNEGSDKGNTRNISSISVQFSHSVVFDSLRPHGLQHARLPCPSAMPVACSNSCPLSWWWHPTNLSSVIPLLLLPSIFTSIKVFSNESVLYIKWPKYWSFSFSISPSSEYSGWISFRIDWLDILSKGPSRVFSNTTVQKHQFFGAQLFFTVQLSHPCITTGKNNSFDYINLCWQSLCFLIYIV